MSDEEKRLIRRAQAGDPAAFGEFHRRYRPRVYRYITFRVYSEATAEDLTSEVLVRLVERIQAVRYRGRRLLAWLCTIARNLIIWHYRRKGRAAELPLDDSLVADADRSSHGAGIAGAASGGAVRMDVEAALCGRSPVDARQYLAFHTLACV